MVTFPTFQFEQELWEQGYDLVIGVDEVGRGSFAGPVVAAAVSFPCHPERSEGSLSLSEISHSREILRFTQNDKAIKIDDSKRLKPQEREKAAKWIRENCLAFGIGEVGVNVINKVGIGKATAQAMRLAINNITISKASLPLTQDVKQFNNCFVLVDAFYIKYLHGIGLKHQKPIIKGDQKSISIAAASIIAKVYRDALMTRLAKEHKVYRWGRNKGYGTRDHQEAIKKNGITKLHRVAFVETFLASQGLALQS